MIVRSDALRIASRFTARLGAFLGEYDQCCEVLAVVVEGCILRSARHRSLGLSAAQASKIDRISPTAGRAEPTPLNSSRESFRANSQQSHPCSGRLRLACAAATTLSSSTHPARLHHPLDVEPFFPYPLIIVEEGNSNRINRGGRCIYNCENRAHESRVLHLRRKLDMPMPM